jgi:D-hydroxyproline dehydrogenase subunit gamma
MPETVRVRVNGQPVTVPVGSTVAVAVLVSGAACRISVTGEERGPLCGMGICFECRVAINGQAHRRGCQILSEPDMEITSDE